MNNEPHIIKLNKIGSSNIGFITVAEELINIPFEVKRVFWTYFTPDSILRGRHAHHHTQMIVVAVVGRIIVTTELIDGSTDVFTLDAPNKGLYLPVYCWHTMQFSQNAVLLVIASTGYDEKDYIRDYQSFKNFAV